MHLSCRTTFLLIEFSKHTGFLFIFIFKSQNAPGKFLSSHTPHSDPFHKLSKLMQGKRHFLSILWLTGLGKRSLPQLGQFSRDEDPQWFHAIWSFLEIHIMLHTGWDQIQTQTSYQYISCSACSCLQKMTHSTLKLMEKLQRQNVITQEWKFALLPLLLLQDLWHLYENRISDLCLKSWQGRIY